MKNIFSVLAFTSALVACHSSLAMEEYPDKESFYRDEVQKCKKEKEEMIKEYNRAPFYQTLAGLSARKIRREANKELRKIKKREKKAEKELERIIPDRR